MSDAVPPPTTDDFTLASRVTPDGDGRYRAEVPDGWQQGRGAFGGLVLGTLARAMLHAEPEAARTLRALTGEIVGPVLPGAADITVKALRRGNAVSTWEAWLSQSGEVLARASAVLGRARTTERDATELAAPATPAPWSAVDVLPIAPPMGPHFARMFEFRPVGAMPFAGGDRSEAAGWVRLVKPVAALGAPEIIGLMDAFWPAAFAREFAPRPMATVAFTLELLADPADLDPAEPLVYRATAPATRHGFSAEFRELWTARGELVALNQQTFVIIK
jgi:acyl-CoA thioesterase